MIFDLFHSISDPVVAGKSLGAARSVEQFLAQTKLAEAFGFDTVWLAESHFSSEVQKRTSVATIPEFHGEVGLNGDSFQWFHLLRSQTKKINLGTGIHNIVGGSGGPIASADRVNTLNFINSKFWEESRTLRLGIASGRFPYQNTPFGISPRTSGEEDFWLFIKRTIFLEALEIFLRLLKGETLASKDLSRHYVSYEEVAKRYPDKIDNWQRKYAFPWTIPPRWDFEALKLVPEPLESAGLRIVLGSADPEAFELGSKYWDLDLFNLSFTPPDEINRLHAKITEMNREKGRGWSRSRLPRTVMVFIDPDRQKAQTLANFVLDTYIEAMRGTAAVPDKAVLLQRALIGDACEVRDQLHPDNPRKFHADDRLILWFEFNQLDGKAVENQMRYFYEQVVARL